MRNTYLKYCFFMNFKVWFYRVDTCKSGFTKTERHLRIFKN